MNLKSSDISLLDIGCGSGRVLSFGMLQKFKEVFGVDLDEPALKRAVDNCNAMQQLGYKTSFAISNEDACSYIIPDSVNVIFLFNPFGEKTMQKVADNIFRHAERIKSNVYIIYSNPANQGIFIHTKRCSKIFESYFKSKKPDISIFKLKASVFLHTTSNLSSTASLDNFPLLG